MLVVMDRDATDDQIEVVIAAIRDMGLQAHAVPGAHRTVVAVTGNETTVNPARLSTLDGVRDIVPITPAYRSASREWHQQDTRISLPGGLILGGPDVHVIAGPCSVESREQILETAHAVKEAGATLLRGGAFKPRTSPYSFQGLGPKGLSLLARAREETGLPVVSEAVDPETVEAVVEHVDIVQVGARNMQNFSLLRAVGRTTKPVLLKRGLAATVTEWLLSAEYILAAGNPNVMLCERGVRGFDTGTRHVLDLNVVPVLERISHLPIAVDPSHGTGDRELVPTMACAAVAAGADAVMVEVHAHPDRALSDGAQSLFPHQFADMMTRLRAVAGAVGRQVAEPLPSAVSP